MLLVLYVLSSFAIRKRGLVALRHLCLCCRGDVGLSVVFPGHTRVCFSSILLHPHEKMKIAQISCFVYFICLYIFSYVSSL